VLARSIAGDCQAAEPERKVEFRIEDGLTTEGDSRLLRLMLENLVGNAWKFTSKGKKALIEFGRIDRDGKQVYFVRDNGAGFEMKYVDKLFGPFQRLHTEKEFPGTGIGLATVRRIVSRHGGGVWAEGEVAKGATIYFTLS
jgi:light-regulated signal transduction histidine kinase (bacteriophytochrome)